MRYLHTLEALPRHLNASWLLATLVALFVLSLAVTVERLLFFVLLREDVCQLCSRLDSMLRDSDFRQAAHWLRSRRSPAAAVVHEGLRQAELGAEAVEEAMKGAAAVQRVRLERGLSFLSTVGNNAPFIGLLGTVLGISRSLEQMGVSSSASGIASEAVMRGAAEALGATAFGLLVALPCVAFHNLLHRCVQSSLAQTDALKAVLLMHLRGIPTVAKGPSFRKEAS